MDMVLQPDDKNLSMKQCIISNPNIFLYINNCEWHLKVKYNVTQIHQTKLTQNSFCFLIHMLM